MLFPEWFEAWLVIAQQRLAVLLVLCVLVYLPAALRSSPDTLSPRT